MLLCFVCLRPVSCVPNVVSGLSIIDYPFGTTIEARRVYPSGSPHPMFSTVHVAPSLVFCVVFCTSFVVLFSFRLAAILLSVLRLRLLGISVVYSNFSASPLRLYNYYL